MPVSAPVLVLPNPTVVEHARCLWDPTVGSHRRAMSIPDYAGVQFAEPGVLRHVETLLN